MPTTINEIEYLTMKELCVAHSMTPQTFYKYKKIFNFEILQTNKRGDNLISIRSIGIFLSKENIVNMATDGHLNGTSTRFEPMKTSIEKYTNFLDGVYINTHNKQRLWHIENNYFSVKTCENKNCHNPAPWRTGNNYGYCSKECRDVGYLIKYENTSMQKYGVTSPSMTDDVKIKQENTNIKNYGVKIASMSSEIKEEIRKKSKLAHETEESKKASRDEKIAQFSDLYTKIGYELLEYLPGKIIKRMLELKNIT